MLNTTLQNSTLYWSFIEGRWQLLENDIPCGKMELPNYPEHYKTQLKKLKINYKIEGKICLIFDPECEEYTEYTAEEKREYYDDGIAKYSITGKKITREIPTGRMLSMAKKYQNIANVEIKKEELFDRKERFDEEFAEKSKDDGVSYCWYQDYDDFMYYDIVKHLENEYFLFKIDNCIMHDWCMGHVCYIVISKSAVSKKMSLEIKVPEKLAKRVIGKNGIKLKEIAKKVGVKHINVKTFNPYEN